MNLSAQFHDLFSINGLVNLIILAILEVVLGIDNLIFISIAAAKLKDKKDRKKARAIGLFFALIIRCVMLFGISWLANANEPLFHLGHLGIGISNMVMFAGGLFLLYKTISEIKAKVYGEEHDPELREGHESLNSIIMQIIVIDFVFSFDSILTAVNVAKEGGQSNVIIMIGGVIISLFIMLLFSEKVGEFINQNPNIKTLALAFLILISVSLILDGFHVAVPKPYLYAALGFSFFIEAINILEKHIRRSKDADNHK